MKYSWNTARGAKIELDIDKKVITEETLWNEGNELTVPCHKWQYTINSLLVNGQEMKAGAYKQQIGRWPENVHHTFVVFVAAHGKKQKAFIEIPDEIENEISSAKSGLSESKSRKRACCWRRIRKPLQHRD